MKIGWTNLAFALAATIVVFAGLECSIRVAYWFRNSRVAYVPLPYVIGHDYGPVPPWMDSLLILAPDKDLIWRNRPNLTRKYVDLFRPIDTDADRLALFRRFSPGLPRGFAGSGSWEITLNSEGFRDRELQRSKPPFVFRVLCLGDSWTFGMNVRQTDAYPQRLGALLAEQFPGGKFEVLNRGVLGYSSYQGLELLRHRINDFAPDVVVIAFGMNDSKVAGYRDKDLARWEKNVPLGERLSRLMRKSQTYKLLQYLAVLIRHRTQPLGFHLKNAATGADRKLDEFEKLEPWTRVGIPDYRKNISEMIRIARDHGAHVILLYNELWEDGLYLRVLQDISKSAQVPLVNGNAMITRQKERIEQELERRLHLDTAPAAPSNLANEVDVIFRVHAGATRVPRAIYLAGAHPALGDTVPNKVAMYDDGTHGDQHAGDSVWSYSAKLPRGANVVYVYTNSGQEGCWEGLDVPHIRRFVVATDSGRSAIYRPIETFGKVYMQADSWHTDRVGYDLIARGVLEILKGDSRLQAYLQRNQKLASIKDATTEETNEQ